MPQFFHLYVQDIFTSWQNNFSITNFMQRNMASNELALLVKDVESKIIISNYFSKSEIITVALKINNRE